MTTEKAGHFIFGITHSGNKFRPSDWVERIAAAFGSFDASQRLRYNPMVRPVSYDGLYCLFVAAGLAMIDPATYDFIMQFAMSNHLQVKDIGQVVLNQSPADLSHVA